MILAEMSDYLPAAVLAFVVIVIAVAIRRARKSEPVTADLVDEPTIMAFDPPMERQIMALDRVYEALGRLSDSITLLAAPSLKERQDALEQSTEQTLNAMTETHAGELNKVSIALGNVSKRVSIAEAKLGIRAGEADDVAADPEVTTKAKGRKRK